MSSSKTLTVANQTEVPILHCVTIILNTTIEDDSRQFTIPFAVADIKYIGTHFFEGTIQNLHHCYPKITHVFLKFTELILKHNYA